MNVEDIVEERYYLFKKNVGDTFGVFYISSEKIKEFLEKGGNRISVPLPLFEGTIEEVKDFLQTSNIEQVYGHPKYIRLLNLGAFNVK